MPLVARPLNALFYGDLNVQMLTRIASWALANARTPMPTTGISKPENAFNFSLAMALVNRRINACSIKGWSVLPVLANVANWT